MKRIGIVLFLAGSLWLLGLGVVHAEGPQHPRHHRMFYPYEGWDKLAHPVSAREVSFEVLRMLSTGMTKAEVLSRVGSPRHRFKDRGTQRWVYPAPDHWIVEVVFSGNTVLEIKWSKT